MDETIFNDEQNNLVIHYTENETSKTLRFPVLTDSIDMDDDIDIKMEKMLKDKKGVSAVYNYSTGDGGNSIDIDIISHSSEFINELDKLYSDITPFTIVFNPSLVLKTIPTSKKWIITDKSTKQDNFDYVVIGIKLHTYNPPKKPTLNTSKLVDRTTLAYKFADQCKKKYKNLNYAFAKKHPKKVDKPCTNILKQILQACGFDVKDKVKVKDKKKDKKKKKKKKKKTKKVITDKYTKKTSIAVKYFKKEWNTFKLSPTLPKDKKSKKYTDIIDKKTYKALCNYNKLVTARKGHPKKAKKITKQYKKAVKKASKKKK